MSDIKAPPHNWPMTMPDVERLNQFVKNHEKIIRASTYGHLVDRLFTVVTHYEQMTINSLEVQRAQRDQTVIFLRALGMLIMRISMSGAEHETSVLTATATALIEENIQTLQEATFRVSEKWARMPDLFTSHWPDRTLMSRVAQLERELEKATGKKPTSILEMINSEGGEINDDMPF